MRQDEYLTVPLLPKAAAPAADILRGAGEDEAYNISRNAGKSLAAFPRTVPQQPSRGILRQEMSAIDLPTGCQFSDSGIRKTDTLFCWSTGCETCRFSYIGVCALLYILAYNLRKTKVGHPSTIEQRLQAPIITILPRTLCSTSDREML